MYRICASYLKATQIRQVAFFEFRNFKLTRNIEKEDNVVGQEEYKINEFFFANWISNVLSWDSLQEFLL